MAAGISYEAYKPIMNTVSTGRSLSRPAAGSDVVSVKAIERVIRRRKPAAAGGGDGLTRPAKETAIGRGKERAKKAAKKKKRGAA